MKAIIRVGLFMMLMWAVAAQATLHQINIQGFAFSPMTLTVEAGDSVRWTNLDSAPHTATADGGAFNSGTLSQNASFIFVFNNAGSFPYHCAIHPSMQATITVQAAPPVPSIVVNIVDFTFSPQMLTLDVGDTVRWINLDATAHTATADGGAFNSGTLNQNDHFDFIFSSAGTFPYHCAFHPTMTGTIQVGPVSPPPTHVVNIQDFTFNPQELTIMPGDTVRWVNMDATAHTATASGGEFNSGTLNQNDFYDHIFTMAGDFPYACGFHPTMTGTIHVMGATEPDYVINIQDFGFNPQALTIMGGETVRWINLDSTPHTATASGGEFNSGTLNQNDFYDHTFMTEGDFAYVCQFHSEMTGVIHVGTGGGGNEDWEELDIPATLPLTDVRFWDVNLGWVAGEQGVFRTENGGDDWDLFQTSDDVEALHFISATEGWLCGNDGMIMHTTNGGASWSPQTSGFDDKLRDIWFADANNGWAVGRDGILLHTSNGGSSWSPQSSPATDDLRGIHMMDDQTGWVVGSDGLILYTTNGGGEWTTQLSVPGGEEDEFEAVFSLDGELAWAVGGQGRVYATTDGGDNWDEQESGTNVALMDVYFTDAENGWACGAAGFLSNAMTGGDMWMTQLPPSFATMNAVYFVDEHVGYLVASDGTVFKYDDGTSAVDQPEIISATSIELLPAYPNPFNPSTTLSLVNPVAQQVRITIYDLLGREVTTLVNEPLSAGRHDVTFDASGLASGLYIAQVTAANVSIARKLTLMK